MLSKVESEELTVESTVFLLVGAGLLAEECERLPGYQRLVTDFNFLT